MKIQALSNTHLPSVQNDKKANTKALFESINKQINTLQNLSESIEKDNTLSLEDKNEKQKKISDQISELKQLLEAKQKEFEKKDTKEPSNMPSDSTGNNMMSQNQMQAIIEASNSFSQSKSHSALKKNLVGKTKILEAQIAADKSRGLDVSQKEKQYAKMQSSIQQIDKSIAADISGTNRHLSKADHSKTDKQAALNTIADQNFSLNPTPMQKQTAHFHIEV